MHGSGGRGLSLVAALIATSLALAACGGDGDDETPTSGAAAGEEVAEITMDYLPGNPQAAVKLADQQGIFEKHGVKMVYADPAANGAARIAQLLNGQLDVATGAVTAVQTAVAEGIGVRVVSAFERDHEKNGIPAYMTVVSGDSPAQSFKDLEGKTIAAASLQGTWEVTVREAVARDGGDPSTMKFVTIPFPDQAAALRQGRVDAVATLQPFGATMVEAGNRSLGDQQAIALDDPNGVSHVVFMAKQFLDEEPEAAGRFVAALTEATEYANAHPREIQELLIEESGAPREVILAAPAPEYTTVMDPGQLERWGELLVGHGVLDSVPPVADVLWEGAPKQ